MSRSKYCTKQSTINRHASKMYKAINSPLYFVIVPGEQLHRYCLVQYSFTSGQEHPIPKMPHGNSKKKIPYVRTWESTKDQLRIVAGEMKAREAIHHAIAEGLGVPQSCVGLGQSCEIDSKLKIWQGVNLSTKEVTHGLGCPPKKFTTNWSERTNGVL